METLELLDEEERQQQQVGAVAAGGIGTVALQACMAAGRSKRGSFRSVLPSIEEAQAYPYSDAERASIARNRSRLFVGSPQTVMEKITPLIETCKADEVMVIIATYDHDARKRSYSLLADAFGIDRQAAA